MDAEKTDAASVSVSSSPSSDLIPDSAFLILAATHKMKFQVLAALAFACAAQAMPWIQGPGKQ